MKLMFFVACGAALAYAATFAAYCFSKRMVKDGASMCALIAAAAAAMALLASAS